MDDQLTQRFLKELRDRISDILAPLHLLTPLVQKNGDQEDQTYLAAMNKSLYRLLRTLTHMTLCSPDPIFQPEPVDLPGLCRDLCRDMELFAKGLGVEFSWELQRESMLSMADNQLMEMLLLNLLSNAFQAAGPGGHVVLRCTVSDGSCRITVQDDGPGLQLPDDGTDPLIKQPGGLGLGLTAARKIAALHGGTLVLQSGEERGVCALLSIPIKKPTPKDLVRDGAPAATVDRWGGFSSTLVELSTLLPLTSYLPKDLE